MVQQFAGNDGSKTRSNTRQFTTLPEGLPNKESNACGGEVRRVRRKSSMPSPVKPLPFEA